MGSEGSLNGREERRLPIMMEVNLAPADHASGERRERTFTDNISPHGVRVHSTSDWKLGEHVEVAPMKGEPPMRGKVVYCQKVGKDRFFIGLKFLRGPVPWSILTRFNGLLLVDIFAAMRWKS